MSNSTGLQNCSQYVQSLSDLKKFLQNNGFSLPSGIENILSENVIQVTNCQVSKDGKSFSITVKINFNSPNKNFFNFDNFEVTLSNSDSTANNKSNSPTKQKTTTSSK